MAEELYVSGVSMKTLAKNVDSLTSMLQSPAFRGSNPISALRSGSIWSGIKPHEAPHYMWPMWVVGCDDDGTIPTGSTARRKFYDNVNQLTALFQGSSGASIASAPTAADPQPGLVRVRHVLPDGSARLADLEVVSAQNFAVNGYGDPVGRFTVELENPSSYWRALTLSTGTVVNGADDAILQSAFAGATAPLDDATLRIYGPCTNPKVYDGNTYGAWFQYQGTLGTNQTLQVDMRPYTIGSVGSSSFVPNYGLIRTQKTLGRLFRLRPGPNGGYSMRMSSEGSGDGGYAELIGYKKYMVG